MVNILQHYSKEIVREEIYNFSKNRWVAFYSSGNFIRYDDKKNPLKFTSPEDVIRLVTRYNARTVYATAGKYQEVTQENVNNDKIVKYAPFFDIDTTIDKWENAVRVAEIIVSFLEKEGVYKSVYLLWSGEGVHVRINEKAIPNDFDPLYASHAIVQYVLKKTKDEILKVEGVKVDDLIDSKRVFTAPLSLHKELDYVAVCFSPNKLNSFTLDYAKPDKFVHEKGVYDNGEKEEARDLIYKAISEYSPRHEGVKRGEEKLLTNEEGKIGRFQVMGILQAARYFVLYGDLEKAKSFGLNRAIFYAWAKYYGKSYTPKYGLHLPKEVKESGKELKNVAGEQVYIDKESGLFIIGDRPQTPEEYDREIVNKINGIIPYEKAWDSAVKYVSSFSKNVLENQRQFYEKVYLPVRDHFIERVVNKKQGLEKFF